MDKLQLALLTQWAEDAGLKGIQGRKRMQKVVYLLQQAGCPLGADYTLHHYGPYSRDVADITDRMVAEGLLNEQVGGNGQYEYRLAEATRPMIEVLRERKKDSVAALENFRNKAVELFGKDLWTLELGSTISFYYGLKAGDWEQALRSACNYKGVKTDDPASAKALSLAKKIHQPAA